MASVDAEFGVSLAAYVASASVIGLAIGFGSQGLVQDVVTGLTLIFSDLIDVGDLVDVSGQTGVVRSVTMRFVELENALGGTVFVPNRTISSVINYPRSYVRCFVDVTLLGDASCRERTHAETARLTAAFAEEFPGVHAREPAIVGKSSLPARSSCVSSFGCGRIAAGPSKPHFGRSSRRGSNACA